MADRVPKEIIKQEIFDEYVMFQYMKNVARANKEIGDAWLEQNKYSGFADVDFVRKLREENPTDKEKNVDVSTVSLWRKTQRFRDKYWDINQELMAMDLPFVTKQIAKTNPGLWFKYVYQNKHAEATQAEQAKTPMMAQQININSDGSVDSGVQVVSSEDIFLKLNKMKPKDRLKYMATLDKLEQEILGDIENDADNQQTTSEQPAETEVKQLAEPKSDKEDNTESDNGDKTTNRFSGETRRGRR